MRSRRSNERFNRGRIATAAGAPADDGTPLGLANYLLYHDPYDYGLVNGDVITAAQAPRVGALGDMTPAASPTVSGAGVNGRVGDDFGTATNARWDAHGYAPPFAVPNRVHSAAFYIRRNGNESGCWWGVGRASATASCIEIGHDAAGRLNFRIIDAAGTAKVYQSTTAQLGFVAHTIGFTIRAGGLLADCYLDGVLVADLTACDISVAAGQDPLITQFRFGTTGRGAAGTDDCAGVMGQKAISIAGASWTAAQQLLHHTYWVAQDPPAVAGVMMYPGGDSQTKNPAQSLGWRGRLLQLMSAAGITLRFVGTANDGAFVNNQHSGYSGRTIAQVAARFTAELGTGKLYTTAPLWYMTQVGANDGRTDGDPTLALAALAAAWETAHTAATSSVPTARGLVSTIANYNPAASTYAWQQAFNAGVPALVAAFNAAHPANKLFYADVAAGLGAWNAANMVDDVHVNNTGNVTVGDTLYAATDADGGTFAAYCASVD